MQKKPAFSWVFPSTGKNTLEFHNSTKDYVLHSDEFVYEGCTFYCECTPNGFSSVGSKEGDCTLWLAVKSLPDGVQKLEATVKFVCNDIGYEASRRVNKLGRGQGCSWSMGMLNTTTKAVFMNVQSWTFHCYINIHKFDDEDNKESEIDKLKKENVDLKRELNLTKALLQSSVFEASVCFMYDAFYLIIVHDFLCTHDLFFLIISF